MSQARIPVLNADGQPLSPCRPERARILLKQRKAFVVSRLPFAIQLRALKENPTMFPTIAALDDGKTTGITVVEIHARANRVVCQVTLPTRGENISDQLKIRRALRNALRNRRNRRQQRNAEPRFAYRKTAPYPPSIRADADTKLNTVKRLQQWYPITALKLEIIKMNIEHLLYDGPRRQKKGRTENVPEDAAQSAKKRLAILARDQYRCLYCGQAVTAETAHVHHFAARKDGGSARYDIQGTLCATCHTTVTTQKLSYSFDLDAYPSIRAAGRAMHGRHYLEQQLLTLGLPLTLHRGFTTAKLRQHFGVTKTHTHDAMVLACDPRLPIREESPQYTIKLHARHGGRQLFYHNPGVAKYRHDAEKQPGVQQDRLIVDDHDQRTNIANRSYRRHVHQKYYRRLRATGEFQGTLLPGKKHVNEIFTVNRMIALTPQGPVLIKNPRIFPHEGPWPNPWRCFERYDIVQTAQGLWGIVTAIMSNTTVRVDFFHPPAHRKTKFSAYKPESLTLIQKHSSQTWIPNAS